MPTQRVEFPFWPLVGAVTLGSLIASAIVWIAVEIRIRIEINATAEALQAATAALEAESVKRLQAAQIAASQARRESQAREAAARDAREGRYLRAADATIPVGELACLAGSIVKRESNGWQQQFDTHGAAIRCRTRR